MIKHTYRNSIYHEVSEEYMPPWAPDTSYMHFIDERILTQSEKDSILGWINDYALPGDTAHCLIFLNFQHIFSMKTDLVINTPKFSVIHFSKMLTMHLLFQVD